MTEYSAAVELYLQYCFSVRTQPRVDELAFRLRMHPSALSRRYRACTGHHLSAVLKERQIREAKRLLASTSIPLRDVARGAGFGTANTLFRMFRRRVGMTPFQYRRTFGQELPSHA